jgi:hypothetical protein
MSDAIKPVDVLQQSILRKLAGEPAHILVYAPSETHPFKLYRMGGMASFKPRVYRGLYVNGYRADVIRPLLATGYLELSSYMVYVENMSLPFAGRLMLTAAGRRVIEEQEALS